MPRRARFQSEYMHVISRGIGKQILFEDDYDRYKFLNLLIKYRNEVGTVIIAYCLMENHVHLLVQNKNQNLPDFMKKIGICYAQYYNKKYDRNGHLFQDRYKSEVVLTEEYLITVFKYIMNNPVKANICNAECYKWSSYSEYGIKGGITDTSVLQNLIGDKKSLNKFLHQTDDVECLEFLRQKHDDEWGKYIIRQKLGIKSGSELQKYDRKKRDRALIFLRKSGLSIRQIERLTGISRGVIYNAKS